MKNIKIDGKLISPISAKTYQELIELELNDRDIDFVFTASSESGRYSVSANDIAMGYYKVLTSRQFPSKKTSILTMHKQ